MRANKRRIFDLLVSVYKTTTDTLSVRRRHPERKISTHLLTLSRTPSYSFRDILMPCVGCEKSTTASLDPSSGMLSMS
jgi:hypothetical protein